MYQIILKAIFLGLIIVLCVTAQPLINNTSVVPECSSNTGCDTGTACIEGKCVDPCDGACGSNTVCHLVDLVPICACKPGYNGHPFTGCTSDPGVECTSDSQCPSDKACVQLSCVNACEGACGLNMDCTVSEHRHKCACKQGFQYEPSIGCLPIDLPECKTNTHCPGDRACVGQKCVDPCVGVCGNNTVCQVTNHYPACACSPGFTGDAFVECKPLCLPLVEKKKRTSRTSKTGLKKKFFVSDEELTWAEASVRCQSQDMALAAIENEEEQRDVERILPGILEVRYYTSGWSEDTTPGTFVWMTTGNRLGYTNWRQNEPEGTEYHCLLVLPFSHGYEWQSNGCSELRRYICQYYED